MRDSIWHVRVANVPIKTYFPDGMFGVMECDVSGVEHLAVHKRLPLNITKSFESFTSLQTINLGLRPGANSRDRF